MLQFDFKCKEGKSSFTKTADGDFCNKCEKTVHDLTDLTRLEMEHLINNADAPLCVSIWEDQLYPKKNNSSSTLATFSLTALLALSSTDAHPENTSSHKVEQFETNFKSDTNEIKKSATKNIEQNTYPEECHHDNLKNENIEMRYLFRIGQIGVFLRSKFPWVIVIRRRVYGKMKFL